MAASKKAAAPKVAPKPKAPAAPKAPQAEAAAAPAGPAAEAGDVAPGAALPAGDGGALPDAPALSAALVAAVAAVAATGDAQSSQDEPQGASPELAEGEVAVSCIKRLERFHRAGLRFTREPLVLTLADLPPGMRQRLKDEPNLVVIEG